MVLTMRSSPGGFYLLTGILGEIPTISLHCSLDSIIRQQMESAKQKSPTHNKQVPNIRKNKSLMWYNTPVSSRTAWVLSQKEKERKGGGKRESRRGGGRRKRERKEK